MDGASALDLLSLRAKRNAFAFVEGDCFVAQYTPRNDMMLGVQLRAYIISYGNHGRHRI